MYFQYPKRDLSRSYITSKYSGRSWKFRKQGTLRSPTISFCHFLFISLIILERYHLTNISQDIIIVLLLKRFKETFLQKIKKKDWQLQKMENLSFQKKIFKYGCNFPSAMKTRTACLLLKIISEELGQIFECASWYLQK